MPKKFKPITLLALIPTVEEAATSIGAEVTVSRSPSSPGGHDFTPEEILNLEKKTHDALWPLAKQIVHLATKGS